MLILVLSLQSLYSRDVTYNSTILLRTNAKRGFTLIELILVGGILGIMAIGMVVVANPQEQFKKANDARRKADLAQIQRSLEGYYQDNGRYPQSNNYRISPGGVPINFGDSWQPYMNIVPVDPTSNRRYSYYVSTNGQSYVLYANLERGAQDPQSCNGGGACANLATHGVPASSCGVSCNYGVSSSDLNP